MKVEPWFRVLETSMFASNFESKSFTIARPNPVPLEFLFGDVV